MKSTLNSIREHSVEKTEVIAIFRPDFFDVMNKNTQLGLKVALKLAQMIGIRLRIANERFKTIETHDMIRSE